MRLGIGITTFPWPAEQIGPVVSGIATAADEAGLDSPWVMDHFFQIRLSGLPWSPPAAPGTRPPSTRSRRSCPR
jgi:alkanesulfonate monooxygenase SsuD/methylene tetrahydromethanopterin reductase-like flavin-dependent oxidoreductase (luciferase family)